MTRVKPIIALIVSATVLLAAVSIIISNYKSTKSGAAVQNREILIYCGITMIRPMDEIARIIEEQEDCTILITKGGSGNLLKAIETIKQGDLYLPGSDSYIKKAEELDLIIETVHVGYNKAAMMVQEGNPKGIDADLDNLASKDLYVVICDPTSGSIGKETRNILQAAGIFDAVAENAREFTTDSKRLYQVLQQKQADLVINWYATSTWDDAISQVDVLPIASARKKSLVLGLLKYSRYPEIAAVFMDYAASAEGRAIFNKYGLYDVD